MLLAFGFINFDAQLFNLLAQALFSNVGFQGGGVVVQVPSFIEVGEGLRIDTETGQYVSRAK